ncbi:TetR/AcrR family transcriptional regulator (plasmid) [Rhizobium leguminosarum]|uniref:TetR/AcrR family transcriptional regulator n=1 Tax=Rhizobium leguminosarum TaxID=384 RepID=A0ACD5FDS9_RHILE
MIGPYDIARHHCEGVIVKISKEQVEQNRERVIDTAAVLFRERGIDGIGVADLMKAAGMTHGGFYRQFKSKDDLIVQAVKRAYDDLSRELLGRIAAADDPLPMLVKWYVSEHHRDESGKGCNLTALATDAARSNDEDLGSLFGGIVNSYIDLLISLVPSIDPGEKRRAAISILSEMVGAVILSRAVPDPAVSAEIIEAVSSDLLDRHRVGE